MDFILPKSIAHHFTFVKHFMHTYVMNLADIINATDTHIMSFITYKKQDRKNLMSPGLMATIVNRQQLFLYRLHPLMISFMLSKYLVKLSSISRAA